MITVDTKSKLFGYPLLAIVCCLIAAPPACGIANSVLRDLPQRRRRR